MRLWIVPLLLAVVPAWALRPGEPMPSLPPTANLVAGQAPVEWSAYRGKVVYVDFWASWCVPCRLSMPALEALNARYAGRGLAVVGVNKDDRASDAQRFLQRYPASFTHAADADDRIVKAFEVAAMPSGYLIDRKGVVRRVHQGFTQETAASLDKEIDMLLKEGA